jgi:uncharacterized membrane-anchored protein
MSPNLKLSARSPARFHLKAVATMTLVRLLTLAGLMACGLSAISNAQAQGSASRTVSFDVDQCPLIEEHPENSTYIWHCVTPEKFEFYIAESDLNFHIGYGPKGTEQKAFRQDLPAFHHKKNQAEFLFRPGEEKPHAVILRYTTVGATDLNTGKQAEKGQLVVVTKIEGEEACHTAYIDAAANPDADALAKKAVEASGVFDCAKDEPKVLGKKGKNLI